MKAERRHKGGWASWPVCPQPGLPHHSELLTASPKPGVSTMVSFSLTPFSSMSTVCFRISTVWLMRSAGETDPAWGCLTDRASPASWAAGMLFSSSLVFWSQPQGLTVVQATPAGPWTEAPCCGEGEGGMDLEGHPLRGHMGGDGDQGQDSLGFTHPQH